MGGATAACVMDDPFDLPSVLCLQGDHIPTVANRVDRIGQQVSATTGGIRLDSLQNPLSRAPLLLS